MGQPVISVRDLVKTYGKVEAVRGIDLEVGAGEIFGFLGPNGAGKSTTISILCTLVRPTSGVAQVAGRSGGADEAVLNGKTGLVVDDPGDPGRVAAALRRLLSDDELRRGMGRAARRRARTGFAWDLLAHRLAAALQDVEG